MTPPFDVKTSAPSLNPTKRIFGFGCFSQLPDLLKKFNPNKILIVLGQKSFRNSPHFEKMKVMLNPYACFDAEPVSQNPDEISLQEEINRLKTESYDLVLAIGGGSVLDAAKLFAAIPFQKNSDLSFYLSGPFDFKAKTVPLIAIPTTAGTGSEVTPYSSVETRDKKKYTISHSKFYPAVAVMDPELTYSMPPYVTASTGFDALSQAIESFWSVHASPDTKPYSLKALTLILNNFEKVIKNPSSAEARSGMLFGSCEAGLAIAQTKTTAVHSVSYPITAYFKVAHGHACALTLSSFVRFNAPVLKQEGAPLLKAFGVQDYEPMAKKIDDFMTAAGLSRHLADFGIDEKGIEIILRDGFRPDRIKNNPRPVSHEDLKKILCAIQ